MLQIYSSLFWGLPLDEWNFLNMVKFINKKKNSEGFEYLTNFTYFFFTLYTHESDA